MEGAGQAWRLAENEQEAVHHVDQSQEMGLQAEDRAEEEAKQKLGEEQEAAKEVAPSFKELSGLRSKVWLSHEENYTYGGVYTWENRQSMENYPSSSFYDEVLGNNPAFVNITYKA